MKYLFILPLFLIFGCKNNNPVEISSKTFEDMLLSDDVKCVEVSQDGSPSNIYIYDDSLKNEKYKKVLVGREIEPGSPTFTIQIINNYELYDFISKSKESGLIKESPLIIDKPNEVHYSEYFTGIFFIWFSITLYLIPSIIGFRRHLNNKWSIFVINFFLGWTLIGWVVSLAWSVSNTKK